MKRLMLKQPAFLLALTFIINLFVLALFRHTPIIVDEFENYNQALNFSNGDFHLLKISAVPGYHALIALCFKTFGISSLLFAHPPLPQEPRTRKRMPKLMGAFILKFHYNVKFPNRPKYQRQE